MTAYYTMSLCCNNSSQAGVGLVCQSCIGQHPSCMDDASQDAASILIECASDVLL